MNIKRKISTLLVCFLLMSFTSISEVNAQPYTNITDSIYTTDCATGIHSDIVNQVIADYEKAGLKVFHKVKFSTKSDDYYTYVGNVLHNQKQFFYAFIGDSAAEMMSVEFKHGETWEDIGLPMNYEFPVFTKKYIISFTVGMPLNSKENLKRIAMQFVQRSREQSERHFCGTFLVFMEE